MSLQAFLHLHSYVMAGCAWTLRGAGLLPYRSANLVQSVTQPAWRQAVMVSFLRNYTMKKHSPNPPDISRNDTRLQAAANRAIDHYLRPESPQPAPEPPATLFSVTPRADTQTLLVNASETLNSAREMASTLAFDLDGSQRSLLLAVHQLVEMSGLLVDRALEQVAPA